MRVADPVGFTNAFGKLEQAIEELVGAGEVKERLTLATMTLVPIFPDDFPAGHLRDECADVRQALSWLPPEEGSEQGLLESTLEARRKRRQGTWRRVCSRCTRLQQRPCTEACTGVRSVHSAEGRLTHMTEQGRPTGIQYEDAADAAMHGGSVDFEGRKVRVLSLNSKTGTDEAPSAQLDLDLGEEYLVLIGYFWDGKFMETSRERPLEDTT